MCRNLLAIFQADVERGGVGCSNRFTARNSRACGLRSQQERFIESASRQPCGAFGQVDLYLMRAADQAKTRNRPSSQCERVDAKPIERPKRVPTKKSSAHNIMSGLGALEQFGGDATARQHDGGGRPGWAATDD